MSSIPIANRYRSGLMGAADFARLDSAVQRPGLSSLACTTFEGSGTIGVDLSSASVHEIRTLGDATLEISGLSTGQDRALGFLRLFDGGGYNVSLTTTGGILRWEHGGAPQLSGYWTVENSKHVFSSFNVGGQELNPQTLAFRPDGTRMFVLGSTADRVFQYSLSTPWDITTVTYDAISFLVFNQEPIPRGLAFGADGAKMYVTGTTNSVVYEYDLATPWNVGTAVVAVSNFNVALQDIAPQDIAFNADGDRMFMLGSLGSVFQYELSTPWVVSSATVINSFSVAAREPNPGGITFRTNGTRMYISGSSGFVYQFNLSTPWDVQSATYITKLSVAAQDGNPQDVTFETNGTKMFIMGTATDTVYEYIVPLADHIMLRQVGSDVVFASIQARE
jgi:hypothetical protein